MQIEQRNGELTVRLVRDFNLLTATRLEREST